MRAKLPDSRHCAAGIPARNRRGRASQSLRHGLPAEAGEWGRRALRHGTIPASGSPLAACVRSPAEPPTLSPRRH